MQRPETAVREATVTDAAAIAHVHRLSRADYYGVPPDPDDDRDAMWAALVDQPERTTYVAEASGDVVGLMSARRLTGPTATVELTALYVLPVHCGHGIGSLLHDLFEDRLAGGGSGVLEVWAGNRRAIEFYRRRGWIAAPETRPGPQDTDFVTYRLPAGGR